MFVGLSPPYATIVLDPPWPLGQINSGYENGGDRALPYSTMDMDDIATLPVRGLAASSAHLYLWIPAAMLRHGFGLVEGWGFTPKQILVWAKPLGTGGRFRQSCEYVIFGERGRPLPVTRHDVGTWHTWRRTGHSVKPPGFFDLVEAVSPGPYVELFARQPRLGWDHWGYGYESGVKPPSCPRCGQPMSKVANPLAPADGSWVWGHDCIPVPI